MSIDLSNYVEVSERIVHFRDAYPDGTLQAEVVSLTDSLVVVRAYAYRTADDPRPGTGLASEPLPGKTPYTKDSELMNAETSAWGRAIIAVGASDAKRGVASANEVRNRQNTTPAPRAEMLDDRARQEIEALISALHDDEKAVLRDEWKKRRIPKLEALTVDDIDAVHDLIAEVERLVADAEAEAPNQ